MFEQVRIRVNHKPHERQILNTLLALVTGILTLVYPDFLYLIAGGYLVALGILFAAFRVHPVVSALPLLAGILIFIFPELIPITFAAFLGLFGIMLLFGFQFSVLGVITLIIAVLIIVNPGSIAYLIAVFLLLYAISNIIRLYRGDGGSGEAEDEGPVSVQ